MRNCVGAAARVSGLGSHTGRPRKKFSNASSSGLQRVMFSILLSCETSRSIWERYRELPRLRATIFSEHPHSCHDGRMRNSDVPMMTMRRAVEWCGGIDALGDALNTTAESLERWLSGEEEVPEPVFLQAVGLILEASASQPPGRSTPDSSDGGRRENRH